jgi:hypothetical protein
VIADKISKNTKGDGIITFKGMKIGVKTADCVPLVILTEKPEVYGTFHLGWRGLKKGFIFRIVDFFIRLGFKPYNLKAIIGPCICKNCYEVGVEFTEWGGEFVYQKKGKYFFDLKGFTEKELLEKGIKEIFISPLCTFESKILPSYRREPENKNRILTYVLIDKK